MLARACAAFATLQDGIRNFMTRNLLFSPFHSSSFYSTKTHTNLVDSENLGRAKYEAIAAVHRMYRLTTDLRL